MQTAGAEIQKPRYFERNSRGKTMVGSSNPYDRAPYRENYRVTTFSFRRCCCCVFSVLFVVAVLIGVIALVIWLVLKPKKPEFDLQTVKLVTFKMEPAAGAAQPSMEVFLSLNIAMVFTAVNPNKVGIKYSLVRFYVMYKGMPIGVAVVPAFYQPAHSRTTVQTQLFVDKVNVMQAAALDLLKDATVNDRVPLRITGDVGARIRVLQITSPEVQVSLDCTIVLSPRQHSLTNKECGVDGVNF